MSITRWRPDTCKCVLEYTLAPGDREPKYHAAPQVCVMHQHLTEHALLATVVAENRAKNNA